jgi:vitamin B12 transporter
MYIKNSLISLIRCTFILFILIFSFLIHAVGQTIEQGVVREMRTPQTADNALSSVTVITRQDIENSQALTVAEILRGVAGLDVSSTGGIGKQSSVFMRGTQSEHIVVLVDGIKIGSATTGRVSFEHWALSQIERIEIVRGPYAGVYGSEAIGGMIQIFTRQGNGKKPTVMLSAGLGDDDTYRFNGGVVGSTKQSWYSLFAQRLQTNGFDDCQGDDNGGCFTTALGEADDDGYENNSYNVRFGQQFGDKIQAEIYALRNQGHTEYDSFYDEEADFVQQVIGLKANYAVSPSWQLNFTVGRSLDELDSLSRITDSGDAIPETRFHTTRTSGHLVNRFVLANNKVLTLGYDYQQDEVDSSIAYEIDSRDNQGIFVQYQMPMGTGKLMAGLRQDDHDQFGEKMTSNLSLGYPVSPTARMFVSYGTAFKIPSLNELYYRNDFYQGNATLDPEESNSFEMGLIAGRAHYQWSVNAYYMQIDKLITTHFNSTTNSYFADNIGKAKIQGFDSSFRWQQSGWELNYTISLLKPEDDTGNLLPRRAEKSIKLEVAERRGAARLAMNVFAQGPRYDDAANTRKLAGYGILNLNGEYNFTPRWTLRFRVENVLDKEYQTAAFYNTLRRFWFVSLHYQY